MSLPIKLKMYYVIFILSGAVKIVKTFRYRIGYFVDDMTVLTIPVSFRRFLLFDYLIQSVIKPLTLHFNDYINLLIKPTLSAPISIKVVNRLVSGSW